MTIVRSLSYSDNPPEADVLVLAKQITILMEVQELLGFLELGSIFEKIELRVLMELGQSERSFYLILVLLLLLRH